MASKLSKIKLKRQRSVLKLIKDREVTDLHSEDNNSDIPSEDELNSPSASRVINLTPGRKRKERSPQEINNNPHKKSIWETPLMKKENSNNNLQKMKKGK